MVPSGRSAMICTVQPESPEIRTRTSRIAQAGQHRLGDRGHAGGRALLDDQARLVPPGGIDRFGHSLVRRNLQVVNLSLRCQIGLAGAF